MISRRPGQRSRTAVAVLSNEVVTPAAGRATQEIGLVAAPGRSPAPRNEEPRAPRPGPRLVDPRD